MIMSVHGRLPMDVGIDMDMDMNLGLSWHSTPPA